MEERREVRIPLETLIKRSWPLFALGAVLLLGIIVGLIWFAVSGVGRKASDVTSTQATTTDELQVSTSTADLVPRVLDGVLVTPAEAQLQPFAVMVENNIDARPLAGPAKANLVYEFPVEGGITRFMLVFDASTTVDTIGPVRSARPYFVDLADGLNAVYAHVGGSPEALTKIEGLSGFRDLNQFFNGKYFWRSSSRVAPHNAYTRTDLLHDAFDAKSLKTGHFSGWHFKDDAGLDPASSTVRGTLDGPNVPYGGVYDVSWKYDQTKNSYTRLQAGATQKDANGSVVQSKNVVVMYTDGQAFDAEGRLHIRTTGHGKADVYRDGKKDSVTWTRNTGENMRLNTIDGNDVLLDRGTTWVEVVLGQNATSTGAMATASTTP